jgi:signal transduction histidine kinase
MREYRKEEVVLDSFFEEVQREMTPVLVQAGVSVMRDVPELATFSDREMLWHVFSNLIQNAVNFRQGDHPRITITGVERNGEVAVRVADNGRGMKADVLEKAFTRFYQSTAADEGSGVGLTICRRIILDLGGRIWLESKGEGKGTTAVVVLPAQT